METKENKWCVYIHRTPSNKAYIGITSDKPENRWKYGNGYHSDNQKAFHRAIQKYGWNNIEHIIWADCLTEEEAKKWEIRLIALFQTNCYRYNHPSYGYNLTDGGDGANGTIRSEETRAKLSAITKERFKDPRNNPMYGKHHSEESKKKISEKHQGKYDGDKNPMYGRTWWDENTPQEKIDEWRKHKSEASSGEKNPNYGIKCTEEKRTKLIQSNPNTQAVIHIGVDGEILGKYRSKREANRITGINRRILGLYCRGEKNTPDGTIWKIIDKGDN